MVGSAAIRGNNGSLSFSSLRRLGVLEVRLGDFESGLGRGGSARRGVCAEALSD